MRKERIDIVVPDEVLARNEAEVCQLQAAHRLERRDRVPVLAGGNQYMNLAARNRTFSDRSHAQPGRGPIPAAFALAGANLFLRVLEDPVRTHRLMDIVTQSHLNCIGHHDALVVRGAPVTAAAFPPGRIWGE